MVFPRYYKGQDSSTDPMAGEDRLGRPCARCCSSRMVKVEKRVTIALSTPHPSMLLPKGGCHYFYSVAWLLRRFRESLLGSRLSQNGGFHWCCSHILDRIEDTCCSNQTTHDSEAGVEWSTDIRTIALSLQGCAGLAIERCARMD